MARSGAPKKPMTKDVFKKTEWVGQMYDWINANLSGMERRGELLELASYVTRYNLTVKIDVPTEEQASQEDGTQEEWDASSSSEEYYESSEEFIDSEE